MDELETIIACQKGHLAAFTSLYDAYHQSMYRFIYYRVHHRETAEDLTSTVFIKALENIKQYNAKKGTFSAWVYRIARNAIIDHVRARRNTDDITAAFDLSDDTNIPRDFDHKEQLQKVWRYLKDLEPKQRDIVIMRIWDGLSHREIAEVLSMSEASVKMAFSRTMSKLNQELVYALAITILLTTNY